jgi:8-oxo-dGTP diphosphatase
MSNKEIIHRQRGVALNAADLVILTIRDDQLKILMIVRKNAPSKGKLALPGGFVLPNEDLEMTARRELAEETGLKDKDLPLLQFGTYSNPRRDFRDGVRVITTAFLAIAPNLPGVVGGTDAYSADWIEVDSLTNDLAFDHRAIIDDAIQKIQSEIEYTPLSTAFCSPEFTLAELRRAFELVWGTSLDAGNFRRKVISIDGFIKLVGKRRSNPSGGRPADLYQWGGARAFNPPYTRPKE